MIERWIVAYQTFRAGFRQDITCPAPTWKDAPDWVRDVAKVCYLQGQLDAGDSAPPQTPPESKFSPGDPVEVRKVGDDIDEIVIRRGDVHIEQMSTDNWFMGINGSDGSYWQFWIGAKNRKSTVVVTHYETVTAQENAALADPSPAAGEQK